MLKVQLSYPNYSNVIKNLDITDKLLRDALITGIKQATDLLYKTVKSPGYVPVDTGKLRDSITISNFDSKKISQGVFADMRKARYAEWVEFGHNTRSGEFVQGSHYMHRSFQSIKPQMSDMIKGNLVNKLSHYKFNTKSGTVQNINSGQFAGKF